MQPKAAQLATAAKLTKVRKTATAVPRKVIKPRIRTGTLSPAIRAILERTRAGRAELDKLINAASTTNTPRSRPRSSAARAKLRRMDHTDSEADDDA